jgi:hypothetical protein
VRHELLTKGVASISVGYLNGWYTFGEQLMSHYWQPRLHELLTKGVASIEVTEAASSET